MKKELLVFKKDLNVYIYFLPLKYINLLYLYLFMGYQYFDYKPLKLFGPMYKIILIRSWNRISLPFFDIIIIIHGPDLSFWKIFIV